MAKQPRIAPTVASKSETLTAESAPQNPPAEPNRETVPEPAAPGQNVPATGGNAERAATVSVEATLHEGEPLGPDPIWPPGGASPPAEGGSSTDRPGAPAAGRDPQPESPRPAPPGDGPPPPPPPSPPTAVPPNTDGSGPLVTWRKAVIAVWGIVAGLLGVLIQYLWTTYWVEVPRLQISILSVKQSIPNSVKVNIVKYDELEVLLPHLISLNREKRSNAPIPLIISPGGQQAGGLAIPVGASQSPTPGPGLGIGVSGTTSWPPLASAAIPLTEADTQVTIPELHQLYEIADASPDQMIARLERWVQTMTDQLQAKEAAEQSQREFERRITRDSADRQGLSQREIGWLLKEFADRQEQSRRDTDRVLKELADRQEQSQREIDQLVRAIIDLRKQIEGPKKDGERGGPPPARGSEAGASGVVAGRPPESVPGGDRLLQLLDRLIQLLDRLTSEPRPTAAAVQSPTQQMSEIDQLRVQVKNYSDVLRNLKASKPKLQAAAKKSRRSRTN